MPPLLEIAANKKEQQKPKKHKNTRNSDFIHP